MNVTNFLGWAAALFVLASFSLKTMTSLRLMAAISNVVFIAYGANVGSLPILVLHTLLFPLNVVRLLQSRRLQQEVAAVSRHADVTSLLMPHMQRRHIPAGQTLFHEGDRLLQDGRIIDDRVVFEINQWGELRSTNGKAEAVMNACFGSFGPIWKLPAAQRK